MECENYIGEHIFFPWSYLVLLSYAVCSLTVCFSWMNPSCSVWHYCNSNSYMQISKNKRHQDRAAALEVWDRLEEFMRSRSRGWGVTNFIKKASSFFMLLADKLGWTMLWSEFLILSILLTVASLYLYLNLNYESTNYHVFGSTFVAFLWLYFICS